MTPARCEVLSALPANSTVPAASFWIPHRHRASVVFPAPLAPTRPTTVPAEISKSQLSITASRCRYETRRPLVLNEVSATHSCTGCPLTDVWEKRRRAAASTSSTFQARSPQCKRVSKGIAPNSFADQVPAIWPSSITTTRSARSASHHRRCSDTMMVFPMDLSLARAAPKHLIDVTSRAAVGSSKTKISGSVAYTEARITI